jgi:hypothetical protein
MASFTTRIELHDATSQDYEALHKKMTNAGFSNQVTGGDGDVYQMPPAEYNYEGNVTADAVREKAKVAAAAVKKSYAVFVTEAGRRAWYGLTRIRKAA